MSFSKFSFDSKGLRTKITEFLKYKKHLFLQMVQNIKQ